MGLGNIMINVLAVSEAAMLVTPRPVAPASAGSRGISTIKVTDTDAVCAELAAHGVKQLNGSTHQPWGRCTAAFGDPAGHVWEVAQDLPQG